MPGISNGLTCAFLACLLLWTVSLLRIEAAPRYREGDASTADVVDPVITEPGRNLALKVSRNSSDMFHSEEWLDFNMIQSGHSVDFPNYEMILADYHRTPTKPIVDAEPCYEGMINGLAAEGMRFGQHQVRKAAYNAILSGAMGHSYGANGLWEFWEPGRTSAWGPADDWKTALDYPGSFDMSRLMC